MNLLEYLKANPFVLAPMAGITDSAFRSFMKEQGAGVVVSELISTHGIQHGNKKTLDMARFEPIERPVGIQLFGESPESAAAAALWVQNLGADFVDLNFGCPVPKVVKKGGGSAMLKDPVALRNLIRAVKQAISVPLTIKIRTGWDENSRNAGEVCQIAYDEGVTWVAIHGRTRAQGYSGWADWDLIGDVKAKAKIPIIGNGDILTAQEANARLTTYGVDGVMIGRGCLKNPWIFVESQNLRTGQVSLASRSGTDFVNLFDRLNSRLVNIGHPQVQSIQLRKFAAWFSAGYPMASQFRRSLFQTSTIEELLKLIHDYFLGVDFGQREDQRHDAFLMGGHG